jgi:hypothetical protein
MWGCMIAAPAPDAPTDEAPAARYHARRAAFARQRAALEARLRAVSHARLATFVATAVVAVWALVAGVAGALLAATVLLAGFVALVVYHASVARAQRRAEALERLNAEGLARLARDWDALPVAPSPADAPPFASDLDLFGRASVVQLLGPVGTPPGRVALEAWLLTPAAPAVIRERQAAVRELADAVDFRDALAVAARDAAVNGETLAAFLAWAESEPWLLGRPGLLAAARGLALGTGVLLAAQLAGLVAEPFWLALALGNLAFAYVAGKEVEQRLDRVAPLASALEAYTGLFGLLGAARFEAPLLRRLQAALATDDCAAQAETRRLVHRLRLTYIRGSQLYLVVQALTLWSFHALALLENWQRAAGRGVRGWLAALGEVEALAAVAALAHDHPDWAFPTVVEDAPAHLAATALGHPLLPDDVRVPNDVVVGPPGTFLLVTGSNMSGKSTLLRALGVNTVLAQAGAPVCARALRLTPLILGTSIRVQDSLERGVSYFMAELQRLKDIVDAAERAAATPSGPALLFLLDEILHGTNTAERQVAARLVVLRLVGCGAIGAVSTHDLSLAASPAVAACARQVHFTEQFTDGPDGPRMTFDYRLRPGLATSTNALKLLQLVGLAAEDTPLD